jgi:hypothetical protein
MKKVTFENSQITISFDHDYNRFVVNERGVEQYTIYMGNYSYLDEAPEHIRLFLTGRRMRSFFHREFSARKMDNPIKGYLNWLERKELEAIESARKEAERQERIAKVDAEKAEKERLIDSLAAFVANPTAEGWEALETLNIYKKVDVQYRVTAPGCFYARGACEYRHWYKEESKVSVLKSNLERIEAGYAEFKSWLETLDNLMIPYECYNHFNHKAKGIVMVGARQQLRIMAPTWYEDYDKVVGGIKERIAVLQSARSEQ